MFLLTTLISVLIIVQFNGVAVDATVCSDKDPLTNYMRCIAFGLNGFPNKPKPKNYQNLEREFYAGLVKQAKECSTSENCPAGLETYRKGDFLKRNGILQRECKLCHKVTKMLIGMLTTKLTAPQRECIRKGLVIEVSKEIQPCMVAAGYGIPEFESSDLQDFDSQSENRRNKNLVVESLSYAVNAFYQFSKCPNRNAAIDCIHDYGPLQKHCAVSEACFKRSEERDQCTMNELFHSLCSCSEEEMKKAKEFLQKVKTGVNSAMETGSSSECADTIIESLVSENTGRNFVEVLEGLLGDCEINIGNVRNHVKSGCTLVLNAKKRAGRDEASQKKYEDFKSMLEIGTALITAAVEAFQQRFSRFCPSIACK